MRAPAAEPHRSLVESLSVLDRAEGWVQADGLLALGSRIDEYGLPSPSSEPHGIVLGPDGALWTALETGAVARVDPG